LPVEQNVKVADSRRDPSAPPVVLLVEDEVLIRMDLAEELRSADFQVIEAGGADEALVVLRSGAVIDAMVSDVRMAGGLDGVALSAIVRRDFPAIRIVLASGDLPNAADLPVDGTFIKPVRPARLIAYLRSLLRQSSAS
jgi:CheY-like chemotaxis protein